MSRLSSSFSSSLPIYITTGAASLCLFVVFRSIQTQRKKDPLEHVVASPLKTVLPELSNDGIYRLPYPPDLFPGVRDVDTPYGSIRVYEWGPEDGRKVLLVHGISTPCLSLGIVAERLVEQGCRVMLFDLFGRGYSDDPSDLPHDARLYTTQILLATASSPLPWTGINGFAMIGYSLGGGIASSFTASFPTLISSLILIAPSGLVRESHIAWQSKILYSTEGILPEPLIQSLVRRRLGGSSTSSPKEDAQAEDAAAAETGKSKFAETIEPALFPRRPLVTVASALQWQLDNHIGFIPAFISSIRHAPIQNQHPTLIKIGARLTAQKANSADQNAANNGLWRSKVLLILGKTDPVVVRKEIEDDAVGCLGRGNLEVVVIEGGHEVPMSKARDVVGAILRFWGEDIDGVEEGEDVEVETGT